MCTTNLYSERTVDGRTRTRTDDKLCARSRNGLYCDRHTTYTHPASLSPRLSYDFPPTPPRSSHSNGGSDSGSSSRRRSSTYYREGEFIIDPSRSSPGRRRNSVVFDEPAMPRRRSSVRHTAPPSPRLNDDLFQVSDPKNLQGMVGGEPRLKSAMKGGHRRETSRGSYHSDEERRLTERRLQDLYFENPEDKRRRERMQKKVEHDNFIINSRPPVPEVPSVTSSSRSYRRPSVVIDRPNDLAKKMAELEIKEARRQEKRDRKAEEEQRQRLRDRMTPGRPIPDDYYYSGHYR